MVRIAILTVLLPLIVVPVFAGPSEEFVLGGLQSARRAAGVEPLQLREDLAEAARKQAGEIARRPHSQRLQFDEPIESLLQRYGIEDARRAMLHVDLKRGYQDPAAAFLAGWKKHGGAWRDATSETLDAVGLAIRTCDDGWIVMVVILLEEFEPVRFETAELRALEYETLAAVNEVRRSRELSVLTSSAALAEVARSHSEDMSVRGYFAHHAPDGGDVVARVQSRGISYRRLGENLHKSRGAENPVQTAVEGWMRSRRHRETMLEPGYSQSAVGVAVDAEGELYFTQLFLLPGD